MGFLKIAKRANCILNRFGYHLVKLQPDSSNQQSKLKLNIGGGDWSHKGWINLDHPSSWYKKTQKKQKIASYDIRNDNLPFENNSVDVIYCSHVIEHIEDVYIRKMFEEVFRVLKKGGTIRIACPDAAFLYQVSKRNTPYWQWRNSWFSSSKFYNGSNPKPVDYLVREIATPKLSGYTNASHKVDYINAFDKMEMVDFLDFLTKDLSYRVDYPGDHINYWTFSKVEKLLKELGFDFIIQ